MRIETISKTNDNLVANHNLKTRKRTTNPQAYAMSEYKKEHF